MWTYLRYFATTSMLLAFTFAPVAFGSVVDEELTKAPSWTLKDSEQLWAKMKSWSREQSLDETQQQKVDALWPGTGKKLTGSELLEHVAVTFAVADPEAAKVVNFVRNNKGQKSAQKLPELAILTNEEVDPFVQNNLRLLYASWLVQHKLHNDALALIEDLKPEDVVDPASLLFYQTCSYHRLLDKTQCMARINTLLENEADAPQRYVRLCKLMAADLAPLQEGSLDEISRIMRNVGDRLHAGRTGKRVRLEEEEIVAKLQKLIEQEGEGPHPPPRPSPPGPVDPKNPAVDSVPGGPSGAGKVDGDVIPDTSNWRDLPPAEREKAVQNLVKDLPAHYREVIEAYFRKLAQDGVR